MMTDKYDKMTFRDSAGNTWSEPIPDHVQVEIAACLALDQLKAALVAANNAMKACRDACGIMAEETEAKQVHAQWIGAMTLMEDALRPVDTAGQALITAVSTMLAV